MFFSSSAVECEEFNKKGNVVLGAMREKLKKHELSSLSKLQFWEQDTHKPTFYVSQVIQNDRANFKSNQLFDFIDANVNTNCWRKKFKKPSKKRCHSLTKSFP